MARAASKPKKEISMEEALWKSADKLRGSVEPAEYKHVVLSLFFLKFASDKFEAQRKAISEKYGEKFVDNVAFYTKDNVFFLPEISRWSFIMENAKQDDISPYQIYLLTNNPAFLRKLRRHAHIGVQVNLSKEDIVNSRLIYAPKEVNMNFENLVRPIFKQSAKWFVTASSSTVKITQRKIFTLS